MKRSLRRILPLPAMALIAVLAGCAAGPRYRSPSPDTPPAFAAMDGAQAAPPATVDLAVWWKSLDDAELDSLVDRAVKSNPDLDVALTRLQQARTYESGIVGQALPEIDATGAAARGTGFGIAPLQARPARPGGRPEANKRGSGARSAPGPTIR